MGSALLRVSIRPAFHDEAISQNDALNGSAAHVAVDLAMSDDSFVAAQRFNVDHFKSSISWRAARLRQMATARQDRQS